MKSPRLTKLLDAIHARFDSQNIFSTKNLIFAIVIFLFIGLFWTRTNGTPVAREHKTMQTDSVDTVIPPGYVLVPIEIQNEAALNGILGDFGVVDLLPSNRTSGKKSSEPVVRRVKIIRAPLNPRQFAVLVPEAMSSRLAGFDSPFLVIVQNPQSKQTQFRPDKKSKINRLFVEAIP